MAETAAPERIADAGISALQHKRKQPTPPTERTSECSPVRFEALEPVHMPKDFSISLDAYRRGGTDNFIGRAPEGIVGQPMHGFEPTYVNIIDYIVRITHRIWEEKDIGYIYDTYSHDCTVWDDLGLQYGRDKIVADTVHTNNAFPDIRLVADEVVWAGNDEVGFHTSHRTKILGTNTGFSRYGAPTGKRIQLWCIANCVARANEIFHEHVIYDTAGLLQQLGLDVIATAKRFAEARRNNALPANFMAGEPKRLSGQGKPATREIPVVRDNIDDFVRSAFHTIWNRRNFGAIDAVYGANVVMQGSTGRTYRGPGQIRAFILSIVAMFPDINLTVDDVYWMGNAKEGYVVSIRWSAIGTHRGFGPYGEPTGKQVTLWGISQWIVKDGLVQKEWAMFNEFGILMQLSN
ncbi:ester cyclase [Ensifer adhaerens]|uniref:ester cyclase n=1 Tax=Ensifer adhaerens TaxID=106592 RepID=UPI001C4DE5C3|nr:ester cyclase [Ensifer adhaerens]MBW0371200.1 ester cyclase [Ensifer adhaerens]UCM24359.1 ester cyclase [Ensifer adhaerens]